MRKPDEPRNGSEVKESSPELERKRRLAAALRENLKRRKARERQKGKPGPEKE